MYKTKLKDTKHLQRHERARKRKKKKTILVQGSTLEMKEC